MAEVTFAVCQYFLKYGSQHGCGGVAGQVVEARPGERPLVWVCTHCQQLKDCETTGGGGQEGSERTTPSAGGGTQ